MLQTLEIDFPGILSEPIEEDKELELNDFSSGIGLLEKMDEQTFWTHLINHDIFSVSFVVS